MRKFLLATIFLLPALFSFGQAPADPRLKGLDTLVARVLREWHAPGVAIAVVEKNKLVYAGGFGYRDVEKKLPVTQHTLFAIGSCTKAFTASMLGMLVKDGKIDIDKPVRNYLPELKFYNDYLNDHVTLRDMMCHRTGLPRHDLSWYGSSASRSELLERIQYMEPSAELREKWQYNNFMFMAQGVVVEKITGKSWEENMTERIFGPLGMSETVMNIDGMEKSGDHSLAYSLKNDSVIIAIPYRNIDAVGPAGSVNSSATDMSKWLITWINGGKFNGKEVIPPGYITQASTEQMPTGGGYPQKENPDVFFSGYGFGWGMSSYRGHYRVEHGGGIDGFISSTGFFPTDSIGIFVVSDQGGPTSSIRNFIADRMLKLSYKNWSKYLLDLDKKAKATAKATPKTDSLNRKPDTKPSHPLKDYAGEYKNGGYGKIEVKVHEDSLLADFNSFHLLLKHYHYDQFNAMPIGPGYDDAEPFKFSFHLDAKGDVEKLTAPMEGGVKDIEFVKELKAISVARADLEKYTGEYELSSVTVKVYIKNDTTLMVLVPGQPDYELVPVKKDEFNLKVMSGYSVRFTVNGNENASELYFVQPNGTFKATRKK